MVPLYPSAFPSILPLRALSATAVTGALASLEALYFPTPAPMSVSRLLLSRRNKRRYLKDNIPDSGYASAEEDSGDESDGADDLAALRADSYERALAIRWLTTFVGRADYWEPVTTVGCEDVDIDARDALVERASSLLARFSAPPVEEEDEPHLTRRFSFPAPSAFEERSSLTLMINVELNDAPLSSTDHTGVGLQSWASAIILARRMCAEPYKFGLSLHKACPNRDTNALRVLELGAGTGLLSIAAAKLLLAQNRDFLREERALIMATDYHPDVLANLQRNVSTNVPPSSAPLPDGGLAVKVSLLDFSRPPPLEPFDVILAADVVYDPAHASQVWSCVERLLKKSSEARFWLAVPRRGVGRHAGHGGSVDAVFGPAITTKDSTRNTDMEGNRTLRVLKREEVAREDGVGRADESGYVLYCVGWVGSASC